MKQFLLTLCISFSLAAGAQSLVLTQAANEPVVGDTDSEYGIDTSMYSSGLPTALTGSNAVWDFTHLQALSPAYSTSYDAPASVPEATAYTGCTVVQNDGGALT